MIWKYNILTIDRLVLCLSLRTLEGNEAQVSFCIIQLLLLKTSEFRNRLQEFVNNNSPEHWKQNNWHERHLAFHQKFPEKFAPDESVSHPSTLPVYFGNVCLRFLPVLDITIHRYLEVPATMSKTLDVLLDHLGSLYKFHDRPITYLYNTLHYYEKRLRERPHLKRRLVGTVIGSLKDVRPENWALTKQYHEYMLKKDETVNWLPELNYYITLVRRMQDSKSLPSCLLQKLSNASFQQSTVTTCSRARIGASTSFPTHQPTPCTSAASNCLVFRWDPKPWPTVSSTSS